MPFLEGQSRLLSASLLCFLLALRSSPRQICAHPALTRSPARPFPLLAASLFSQNYLFCACSKWETFLASLASFLWLFGGEAKPARPLSLILPSAFKTWSPSGVLPSLSKLPVAAAQAVLSCCRDGWGSCSRGFVPARVHAEFDAVGLQRQDRLVSVNLSHFPYRRTQCCFCKSKI